MASNLNFVQYVCEQIGGSEISYKKMFGEFGVYYNNKIIGLICDDQFFVKVTEAGKSLLKDCTYGEPYKGAKPHFLIENVEDKEFLSNFIKNTYLELPEPKPKKKKQ